MEGDPRATWRLTRVLWAKARKGKKMKFLVEAMNQSSREKKQEGLAG